MRMLLIGLAFASGAAAAGGGNSFQPAAAAVSAHPELYSFADVYRLTVGGLYGTHATGLLTIESPEAPVRVAVAQPAEPRFTVTPLPQPDRWLLIVAGLALAGWVAHRRLVHSL